MRLHSDAGACYAWWLAEHMCHLYSYHPLHLNPIPVERPPEQHATCSMHYVTSTSAAAGAPMQPNTRHVRSVALFISPTQAHLPQQTECEPSRMKCGFEAVGYQASNGGRSVLWRESEEVAQHQTTAAAAVVRGERITKVYTFLRGAL